MTSYDKSVDPASGDEIRPLEQDHVSIQPVAFTRTRQLMIGATTARSRGMRIPPRFRVAALLSVTLTAPLALAPAALRAQDHDVVIYHDKAHHDDHHWDGREDQAYRMYGNEHHYKYREFHTLNAHEQQSYWGWRHKHSDAVLKIEVR
jgi:hypothetical protein